MTTAEPVPARTTRHPQVLIEVGGQRGEVDELLAPLLEAMWELGIRTEYSCQQQGWVPENAEPDDVWSYILFASIEDYRSFLDLFGHSELSSRRFSQPASRAEREHHKRFRWRHSLNVNPPTFGRRDVGPDHPEIVGDLVHLRARLTFPADDIEAMTNVTRSHTIRGAHR